MYNFSVASCHHILGCLISAVSSRDPVGIITPSKPSFFPPLKSPKGEAFNGLEFSAAPRVTPFNQLHPLVYNGAAAFIQTGELNSTWSRVLAPAALFHANETAARLAGVGRGE